MQFEIFIIGILAGLFGQREFKLFQAFVDMSSWLNLDSPVEFCEIRVAFIVLILFFNDVLTNLCL